MTELLQQIINGLSLGAIYALIALGYTMVYGVLRFINFAHSDVFMVGAFCGYYLGNIFHGDMTEVSNMPWPVAATIGAIFGVMFGRTFNFPAAWQRVSAKTAAAVLGALLIVGLNSLFEKAVNPLLPHIVIKNVWISGILTFVISMVVCAVL